MKTVKITSKQLNEMISKIIDEATLDTIDTWAKLVNIQNRQVLIGKDGTMSVTNAQNKSIKLRFSGKVSVLLPTIEINVGRIDETGTGLTITTRKSKNQTSLTPANVDALIKFVDNPSQKEIEFKNVKVFDPATKEEKTGTIVVEKV